MTASERTGAPEEHRFQAETRQLLDLMINSIYSNKDTFLRELISNGSDALDKLRLTAFRDKELQADLSDPHIELIPDAEAHTLAVRDNGIGMSRDEVVDLIGTIAKSGTAQLREAMAAAKDASSDAAAEELIGQFGIGFYSSFMVADSVSLLTRKAGESVGTRWESTGSDTFTVADAPDAPQGTTVVLTLKPVSEDDHIRDYTDRAVLDEIVTRYSDFIEYPVRIGDDALNSQKALWTRPKDEVSADEYRDFYRHIAHAWDEPIETIAMKAEGTFEFEALLFIPSVAPFDLFTHESRAGISLYVRRVFIMDDAEELVPPYLRFVKGVVDAADLSLNVSREILQQDRQIRAIRRSLTRRVLAAIKDLQANDTERYTTVWTQFGRALKEGLITDPDNRTALLRLASFASTADPSAPTTLAEYVERMPEGQQAIYYLTGESRERLEASPHMEALRAKGFEVLLLTDPVDEMWVEAVDEYEGTALQSIAKGDLDLESDEEKAAGEEARGQREEAFAPFLAWVKSVLGDAVREVTLSNRLTESPAVLVGDAFSMSPALEKLYRASGQALPPITRNLELNPEHPLVLGLRTAHDARPLDEPLAEAAKLLLGSAVLADGGELDDPALFARTLTDYLAATVRD